MQRIALIGATGAGKSTLAAALAEKKGLAVIELDDLYWRPGWRPRPDAEFRALVDAGTAGAAWISVGNYGPQRDVIWPRADTILWLDYPFHVAFTRLFARSMARIRDKRPVCGGNVETWQRLLTPKNSIIAWLFKSYWKRRREFGEVFDNPGRQPHINLLRFRSPEETSRWLESVS